MKLKGEVCQEILSPIAMRDLKSQSKKAPKSLQEFTERATVRSEGPLKAVSIIEFKAQKPRIILTRVEVL